eukprot:CAMPEP_0174703720 /NCGR_PEP_ID=MMETSP1094-20130205/7568_1 /TAXON_ID=156173 /ORGANISM="Chrysochromulina brevifilum, Strain UTEX LB 985" /LENGTH=130 /DNA_ID=CAMNT_0015901679 /DNA_START=429 /DNA_END=820 /DNA_ORIENTATION=-
MHAAAALPDLASREAHPARVHGARVSLAKVSLATWPLPNKASMREWVVLGPIPHRSARVPLAKKASMLDGAEIPPAHAVLTTLMCCAHAVLHPLVGTDAHACCVHMRHGAHMYACCVHMGMGAVERSARQ